MEPFLKFAVLLAFVSLSCIAGANKAGRGEEFHEAEFHVNTEGVHFVDKESGKLSGRQVSLGSGDEGSDDWKQTELLAPKGNTTASVRMTTGTNLDKAVERQSTCQIRTYYCIIYNGIYVGAIWGSTCRSVLLYRYPTACPSGYVLVYPMGCPGLQYCALV